MFETTATLYSETITLDEYLNEVKTYTGHTVFVRSTRGVYATDFYQAAAQGMKPSAVLTVFFGDYAGEKVVGWNGGLYRVTRTYFKPDSDDLELTIEEDLQLKFGEGASE